MSDYDIVIERLESELRESFEQRERMRRSFESLTVSNERAETELEARERSLVMSLDRLRAARESERGAFQRPFDRARDEATATEQTRRVDQMEQLVLALSRSVRRHEELLGVRGGGVSPEQLAGVAVSVGRQSEPPVVGGRVDGSGCYWTGVMPSLAEMESPPAASGVSAEAAAAIEETAT